MSAQASGPSGAKEPTKLPGQTPELEHPHPNRHRRALRSALIVAGLGLLVFIAGFIFLVMDIRNAYLVSLMVIGVTLLLLAPVWYFSYMEKLEPELYAHDTPTESNTPKSQEGSRR